MVYSRRTWVVGRYVSILYLYTTSKSATSDENSAVAGLAAALHALCRSNVSTYTSINTGIGVYVVVVCTYECSVGRIAEGLATWEPLGLGHVTLSVLVTSKLQYYLCRQISYTTLDIQ